MPWLGLNSPSPPGGRSDRDPDAVLFERWRARDGPPGNQLVGNGDRSSAAAFIDLVGDEGPAGFGARKLSHHVFFWCLPDHELYGRITVLDSWRTDPEAVQLVDELTTAFTDDEEARLLVIRAGFPPSSVPGLKTAQTFWPYVVDQAFAGLVPNGLQPIADEAARLRPHNEVFKRYRSSLSIARSILLDPLHDLLVQVRWRTDDLLHAYESSHPGGPPVSGHAKTPRVVGMSILLAAIGWSSNGTHPHLAFVCRLVELARWRQGEMLKLITPLSAWLEDAANRLGCPKSLLTALQERVAREAREPPELHLVLALKPADVGYYRLQAWRVLVRKGKDRWDPRDMESFDPMGVGPYRIGDLEELLNRAWESLSEYRELSENQLTIELFVPMNLLLCDADRWELDLRKLGKRPFGVQCRIVLRSWERSFDPDLRDNLYPQWKARWSQGLDPLTIPILTCVPEFDESKGCYPVLMEMLMDGMGVGIWPRIDLGEGSRMHQFIGRIRNSPLDGWRDSVLRWRHETRETGELPGAHLTLLWDDPNKLPVDALGRGRGRPLRRI